MMVRARTAKEFQDNGQNLKYQDSMEDNPYSGDRHKTQISVKFQIEEDKVTIVTHWQVHTDQGQVRQEQDTQYTRI